MDTEYNSRWSFLDQSRSGIGSLSIAEVELIIECNKNIIKNLKKQRVNGSVPYDDAILMLEVFNNYYRIRLRQLTEFKAPDDYHQGLQS
ncbi:hypothetical protein [Ekhidna sp.]|uniref:hypothetical protein n=1 Tax=Ekhidna sp. TaxID=2608089 RepID=UPI00329924C5